MKTEIRLGMSCRCSDCGYVYDGTVVTRVGEENMEVLIGRVSQAGPEAAEQLVNAINLALENHKDEVLEDITSQIESGGQPEADWSGVIGWEFHKKHCPKCQTPNLPLHSCYHYFDCDCGGKTILEDTNADRDSVTCGLCGESYEADYALVKGGNHGSP